MPSKNSGDDNNPPFKKGTPPPDLPVQDDGSLPPAEPPKKFEFHAPGDLKHESQQSVHLTQQFIAPADEHIPKQIAPFQEPKAEFKPELPKLEFKESETLKKEFKSEPQKTAEKKPDKSDYIFYLEVDKIIPNRSQPRRHFSDEGIRELASSIREFGVLQPIVVTKKILDTEHGTDVEYELIAGERRLRAVKLLGLPTIPAIVRNMDLERERLELAVIENLQRENLNVIEVARSYARLQDEFRMTQREVAAKLGKSRETVANTLRLLDLPVPIQESLEIGRLSESHGRLLLTVDDPALQQRLFEELLQKPMTTRELKSKVQSMTHKEKGEGRGLPTELKMLQERLSSELGAPVIIDQHGESGKITIRFYSPEELQQIIQKLGKGEEF